jgi:uncharacterized delta-60 repeat protein
LLLGSATTSLTSRNDIAYGLAIQSDGKILAAGTSNAPGSDGWASNTTSYFAVVRYNADLTLDTTFGSGGSQTTAMNSLRANQAQAIALQPADGKSVLAGWTSSGSKGTANDDFAVARYTTSGVLDTTFGNGKGYVVTNLAGKLKNNTPLGDRGEAMAIDSSGKIVVAGWASNGTYKGFAIARYTSSGALDSTFNSKGTLPGTVISYPVANADNQATSIAIQPDGKIVVGGYSNQGFVLERFNASGMLDTTFGSAGIATFNSGAQALSGIAFDASGRIVASGQGNGIFLVARFTSTGALDTTFNSTGYEFTDVFPGIGYSAASAVTIESNGDIAAVGAGDGPDTATQMVIVEYTPSGVLDTTFNGTGIFTHEFTNGSGNHDTPANAIGINSAGNFVVAGLSGNNASSQNPDFLVAIVDPPSSDSASTAPAAAPSSLDSQTKRSTANRPTIVSLPVALQPSATVASPVFVPVPPLAGSGPTTAHANLSSSPPSAAAGSETRVGLRAEVLSGGADKDAIDQAFIDWQPNDVDAQLIATD